jgi:alpha-N-arabinofuranosidase
MRFKTVSTCTAKSGLLLAAWLGLIGSGALPQRADEARREVRRAEPTRALFRYQRDDQAQNGRTLVRINAAHAAAAPINPFLFGNFLEHLGGAIYGGVWSQLLTNPNLEQIEPGDRAPQGWEMTGPALWQPDGYLSPRCVRLPPSAAKPEDRTPPSNPGQKTEGAAPAPAPGSLPPTPVASLSQTIYLPGHRESKYLGYVYVRAPEGAGQITVALMGTGNRAERALMQSTLTAEKATWRKLAFPFVLPTGVLAKGEPARFIVSHAGGGPVDVDQLEIFPDDNFLGMDIDVIRTAQALQAPVLRYPGGNFSSGYHWQDALNMRERRPTRRNAAWGGLEPNHFGINEFIRFCKLLRAQPQLVVNAGDGTPQEAAAWVQYCNSAPRASPYGMMRASNGSPEEYEVKLWEIGNELYGPWEIGRTDEKGNAERFVRFRDAMRAADNDIALIATGKGDEFTQEGMQRNEAWNETLLRAAIANRGKAPDYLSIHPLVPLPGSLGKYSYAEQYESAMAHPTFLDNSFLPALTRLIASVEGPNATTRIAATEWGIIVGGEKWQESPNHDELSGAIYNALTLNAMLRNSDQITLANMTALMHGGGIKKPKNILIVDPQYWTQRLYTVARPYTPVETVLTGPGKDVPARGFLPAVANVPDVDVFSALTEDGKKLLIFAVNRQRTEERPLAVQVDGFAAETLSGTILTGPDTKARNTIEKPDAVAPRPFTVPAWPAPPGSHWQVTLPPHSLVVLTLQGK